MALSRREFTHPFILNASVPENTMCLGGRLLQFLPSYSHAHEKVSDVDCILHWTRILKTGTVCVNSLHRFCMGFDVNFTFLDTITAKIIIYTKTDKALHTKTSDCIMYQYQVGVKTLQIIQICNLIFLYCKTFPLNGTDNINLTM